MLRHRDSRRHHRCLLPAGEYAGDWMECEVRSAGPIFMTANRDNVPEHLDREAIERVVLPVQLGPEPAPWNDVYGAAHAFDLPFIFGNFGPSLFSTYRTVRPTSPGGLRCRAQ